MLRLDYWNRCWLERFVTTNRLEMAYFGKKPPKQGGFLPFIALYCRFLVKRLKRLVANRGDAGEVLAFDGLEHCAAGG